MNSEFLVFDYSVVQLFAKVRPIFTFSKTLVNFTKNQPVKIGLEEIGKLENGSKWYEKLSLES